MDTVEHGVANDPRPDAGTGRISQEGVDTVHTTAENDGQSAPGNEKLEEGLSAEGESVNYNTMVNANITLFRHAARR
jgi:hypothetical protein